MRILRLIWVHLRVGAMAELAYRTHLYLRLFQSAVELATALATLGVMFSYTDTIGGWRPDEIIALLGIYFLVGGFIQLIIQPGMEDFIESVREGTLDFTLAKPVDAQLLVSIRRIDIWSLVDVLLGAVVLGIALSHVGGRIGGGQALVFAVLMVAGISIVYSFWLILSTTAFWFVRVENILVIFQSMYEAGRWPISLYPRGLRYALTFVVPVAFATTIPAEALTGRIEWRTVAGAVLLACALLLFSRFFWHTGLRRYAGASA